MAFNPSVAEFAPGPSTPPSSRPSFCGRMARRRGRHHFPPNGGRRSAARAPCSVWGAGTSAEKKVEQMGIVQNLGSKIWHTVDGNAKSESPVDRSVVNIPIFIRFQPSKVVQDFFHPQCFLCFDSEKWIYFMGMLEMKISGSLRKQNSLMLFGLGHWSNFG